MRIWVTGKPFHKAAAFSQRAGGYTLVELLVVLAIIVILTGMVSLSAGLATDDGDAVQQEVHTLLDLMEFAAEEAVLSGEMIGLVLTPPVTDSGWRYHWRRYSDGWQDAAGALAERSLPPQLGLQLQVDGEPVVFEAQRRDESAKAPAILFDPAGDTTSFVLTLSDATSERRATLGIERGRVQWLDREPAR